MAVEAEKDQLPTYLKAKTPDALRELMLANNLRLGAFVRYQDICELKDGSWICWYYDKDASFDKVMQLAKLKKAK